MSFPKKPIDNQQYTLNGLTYTYNAIQFTWYAEGSSFDHLDPQIYSRVRNWDLDVDIVSTYEGHQYYAEYVRVDREVATRVKQIDKLIEEFNELTENEKTLYGAKLSYLQDLRTKTLDVLNFTNINDVNFPPSPPLTLPSI